MGRRGVGGGGTSISCFSFNNNQHLYLRNGTCPVLESKRPLPPMGTAPLDKMSTLAGNTCLS